MRDTLFRAGLARARQESWHGNVLLLQPLSLRLISACIMLFAAGAVAFAAHAQYTRRIPAPGVLLPDRGLIQVQSPQAGIIVERRVREGQAVRAGDVLYVVSSEVMYAPAHGGAAGTGATASVLAQLQARQQLIEADSASAAAIAEREHADERRRIASLQQELAQLDQEFAVHQERLRSRTEVYQRHAEAQAQGFLSPLALQQKYDELLDYKTRLQSMQRSRLGLARELEAARTQVATRGERTAMANSQLERQAVALEQDRVAREAGQRTLVTATQDGIVAAVLAEPGQRTDGATMLTIIPRGSLLEAQVMLPSSAVGLVREGDPVSVRFDAYPYQRFGGMNATVTEIGATAVPGEPGQPADGRFRVRVALPSQALEAAGRRFPLRSGMQAEIRFVQERRTLLQWLVAPVAALTDNT